MFRYTLMRLGIFVGCLVVVWGLVYSGIAPAASATPTTCGSSCSPW